MVLLMGGIVIYMLFRSSNMLVFRLTDALGMQGLTDGWRKAADGIALPEWALYSLPNGLWALSYVVLIDGLFHRYSLDTRMAWAAAIPLCGVAGEILQAAGIVPGTFDWVDIAFLTMPYLCYYAIITFCSAVNTQES